MMNRSILVLVAVLALTALSFAQAPSQNQASMIPPGDAVVIQWQLQESDCVAASALQTTVAADFAGILAGTGVTGVVGNSTEVAFINAFKTEALNYLAARAAANPQQVVKVQLGHLVASGPKPIDIPVYSIIDVVKPKSASCPSN